ncbi:MAG: ABC transporter ATP-binding protein [Planctomyces sp.]|jgi:ABC-2 type transport system ATP-binding protein|nr:ABC transporter ATP-binding protein [Planctomyces sp.]GDX92622.1 ABC transporter ATP-binding protein [Planctomycetia bacterium]HAV34165.1 ABC transporter ATP-binding protein [Planctomycetaceae bacterium]HBC61807.1 ABC transporter ATP-binding protein [Planctomycetaceae bacterium]
MASDQPVVEISELSKHYGEFVALDRLSLSLNRGSILGFIGPNGAGKTTTIRILVGLSRPTSGTAKIAGADCVRELSKVRRLVGYMPDKFGSYDNMRVREYLDFFGAAFGIPRKERQKRVSEVLDLTNAVWMQDRYVESLSHGMQQRVGIARTLLHRPEVLILDEPANGLDPEARIEMRTILLRLAAEGRTLIVTSHILPELSRICDQVAIVAGGKLRAMGTLQEVTRTLSQRRTVEIQLLSGEGMQAAAARVKKALEADAEVTVSEAETIIRARTSAGDDTLGELLRAMVLAGDRVGQFREVAGDLEEAFVTAAREAEAERDAAGAAQVASREVSK